jgi:hypothetical protein
VRQKLGAIPKSCFLTGLQDLQDFKKSSRSSYPVKKQGCLILDQLFGITPQKFCLRPWAFLQDFTTAMKILFALIRGCLIYLLQEEAYEKRKTCPHAVGFVGAILHDGANA